METINITGADTYVSRIEGCKVGTRAPFPITRDEIKSGKARRRCHEGGIMARLQITTSGIFCSVTCNTAECPENKQ